MSNYEEKEAKALVKIADVLNKLDSNLEELDSLNEDAKKHSMRKWLVEKKAMHEIKKIVHEAGKYEKYDEKELQKAPFRFCGFFYRGIFCGHTDSSIR